MKNKKHLLRSAAVLCTALSMSFSPVFALEDSSSDFIPAEDQTSQVDSQMPDSQQPSDTDTDTDTDSTVPSETLPDSQTPSEQPEEQPSVTPAPEQQAPVTEPIDTVIPMAPVPAESVDPETAEDEQSGPVVIAKPEFNAATNELTCKVTLNKAPKNLAYQFNWATSSKAADGTTIYGPTISEKPVSVMLGTKELDLKPTLITAKEGEGAYKFNFTEEDLKDVKDGDVLTIVFQAYPALEENAPGDEINMTQQVYTGDQIEANDSLIPDKADEFEDNDNMYADKQTSIKVEQDMIVDYTYMPDTKTWQMKITLKTKPEEMVIGNLVSDPDVLDASKAKVKLDNAEVKPTLSKDEIKFSADDVAKMKEGSVILVDFPLDIDKETEVTVDADIDNGVHMMPLTFEFKATVTPSFKATYDYDSNNQTFTAKVVLNQDPGSKFVLKFSQDGDYLKNPTSFKVKNGSEEIELKPDVKVEKDDKKNDTYLVTFSEDDVKKLKKDSEITAVFPVNASKKQNATVYMTIEDSETTKELKASFEIKPKEAPTTSDKAKTGAQSGLYAGIAVCVAAAIGMIYFLFKSRKASK